MFVAKVERYGYLDIICYDRDDITNFYISISWIGASKSFIYLDLLMKAFDITALRKICQNTSFLWPILFRMSGSRIYESVLIRENTR